MFAASKTASVSAAVPDGQFNYVTMLLHGDGTNGAQNNTFIDSSTNAFSITRNGNTTQGSFSPYGSNWSNYFDGSSYLNVASATASGSGSFCLEAWIYLTNITAQQQVIANATSGGMFLGINVNAANKLGIGRTFVAIDNEVSFTWVANTWYHIAVNRSGSSLQFFVNGTQVGTTGSNSINYSTSGRQIGSESNGTSNFYGYISNLRCVNASVYTTTFTPSTTPLTAITSTTLLTCQSNRFIDNSTNAFAITATGTSVQRFNPFGTSTAYSTSVIGGSGYFDGSGDYLDGPTNAAFAFGTGDFTLSAWVYIFNGTSAQIIWTNQTTSSASAPNIGFFILGNKVCINNTNTAHSESTGTIANNSWNYVGVTKASGTYTFYINGSASGTTSSIGTNNFTENACHIGYGNYGTNYNFGGYIADLRVIKGSAVTPSVPTAPVGTVTNTQLLLNMTNGAIFDNAMMNDLETVGNAQISTSVKKFGTGSLYFSGGGGNYAVSPYSTNLDFGTGNATIEFWVYPSSTSAGYQGIISKSTASPRTGWTVFQNGTTIRLFVATNASEITSSSCLTANTWTFISITKSGSDWVIYADGVNVGGATGVTYSDNTARGVSVGEATTSTGWNASFPFTGYIDDLRITKGYARYTTTFTAPTSALSDTGPY